MFSGIVLLPVLLPVAGTDHALDLTAAAGISKKNASNNDDSTPDFPQMERLALGNVQVISLLFAFVTMSDRKYKSIEISSVIIYSQKLSIHNMKNTFTTDNFSFLLIVYF